MKLTCAIIDDEPFALGLIESYVRKTPFLELTGKYSSAVLAMKDIQEKQPDLLFLDIQMPELSGMEFSHMIGEHTRIIFTTAFSQYAVDGYRVNALDYLLKPISYTDFLEAVQKAVKWFGLTKQQQTSGNKEEAQPTKKTEEEIDSIYVKSDYKLVQIKIRDILYVEGLKDYVKIHTESQPRPILSLLSLKAMEELLPAAHFMRVHRSFIVNKDKITVIDRNRIVFGKVYIPISDTYKKEFQEYLDKRSIG